MSAVALLTALLTALGLLAAPATAVEDVTPARVSGDTRTETAAEIARLSFPGGTTTAVVATSQHFQDALIGAGLAGVEEAAQLLVRPDGLPDETAAALDDLGVADVLLLGDEDRVTVAVEEELAQSGRTVQRVAGDDPPALAAEVADVIELRSGLPVVDGRRTVLIANAARFADAIPGSAPAYAAAIPVLFSDTGGIYAETQDFLAAHDVEQAVLLGGDEAIGPDAERQIQQMGVDTTRLAGPSRAETALAVADWAGRQLGFDVADLLIARGDDFPDALTAAQRGGRTASPVLLTATPEVLPDSTAEWIRTRCPVIEVVRAVGGRDAITTRTLNEVERAAETCGEGGGDGDDGIRQTYVVTPQEPQTAEAPGELTLGVPRRYDDQSFTGPVDVVLFPCEGADVLGSDDDTFADVDDDGAADGFGRTDTGRAVIVAREGEQIDPTTVLVAATPGDDGVLDVTVGSQGPDCTVAVVVAGDGDGELDLDAQDRPIERYGVTVLRFE